MLKVDTHFHPNFLFAWNKEQKAKNIWKKFEQVGLDAVIVAEHAYKKAQHAFEFLLQHKPSNAKTHVIPGVEALTEEGADMIVFSQDPDMYRKHEKLVIPRAFSMHGLVDYVEKHDDLFAIITHPFSLSKAAIANHISLDKLKEYTQKLKLVEFCNASLKDLSHAFEFLGLDKLLPGMHQRMVTTTQCPQYHSEMKDVVGLVGSDAHHIEDIGTYAIIDTIAQSYNDVFQAIISHKKPREVIFQMKSNRETIQSLRKNGLTSLSETLIEKLHLYKLYQKG